MLKSPTTKTMTNIPSISCPLSWKWCWSRPPSRPRPISLPQIVLCQLRHRHRPSCLFSSFHWEREQSWNWSFNSDCNVSSLSWAMPYFDCITFIFPLRLQGFNFGPGEITWGQFCKSLQENPFLCVAVSLFASFCKQPTKTCLAWLQCPPLCAEQIITITITLNK